MIRVLIGEFGSVLRLGLEALLHEEDIAVVAENGTSRSTLSRLIETLPDVVVLDLDSSEALANKIAHEYPAVKVIACSSVEPTMRIFPPFHGGESYSSAMSPESFVAAVKTKT